jgi:integrase
VFGHVATGGPVDNWRSRRTVLDPAARAAGIEPFGFHTLRHTCATRLLAQGVSPLAVSRMLGHHSAVFTMDVYGAVRADDMVDPNALPALGEAAR